MQCIPITTRIFQPPQDDLYQLLDEYLHNIQENDIVLISSKVMAIHQGRCIPKKEGMSKHDLVKEVTDKYLKYQNNKSQNFVLTIVENAFISSAGIDASNADGYFVYLPKKPSVFCQEICHYLKKKHKIQKLAVIAIDSHSLPLRYGALGVSIGMFGLRPLRNYVGTEDIFGRVMCMTRTNVVDSLAALATLVMGEGKECRPLAIARGVEDVEFVDVPTFGDLIIPTQEDMYYPLLKLFEH